MADLRGLPWGRAEIEAVLPHRAPFLFLDQVTELVPGQRAAGTLAFSGQEFFFPGHFPGHPIVPGVIILEALAQLGAAAMLCAPGCEGQLALFGGVDQARFRLPVRPGASLRLEVEITARRGRYGRGRGRAFLVVDGPQLAAEAELTFALAPRGGGG